MKKAIVILLALTILGCTTTYKNILLINEGEINLINSWVLNFKYQMALEATNDSANDSKSANQIQTSANFQLRDDIFYYLKTKGIKINLKENNESGIILIHPVFDLLYGQFRTLDITISNKDNDLLARIKLTNGDGRTFNPGRDNNSFAEFAAEQILALINIKNENN